MSQALTKVDWLAFTIPMPAPSVIGSDEHWESVFDLMELNGADVWSPIWRGGDWEVEQGRGVYQFARVDAKSKIRLSIGDVNSDVYVEVSGQACDYVRGAGVFYEIFQQEAIRFSRIDLACDFESDVSVDEIIGKGYKASIKSRADYRTVQGDTTYVGSRKSERMLRVYRYHSPHPRSHLLRCEVELKGHTAKLIARQISESSVDEVCLQALKVFALRHELIASATARSSALPARAYDKAKKGRMRWLLTQVLPALVKAHKEGDIDARTWCEQHLFPLTD